MKNEIRNIIFDLGGVVLNIDQQLTIDAFEKIGWKNWSSGKVYPPENNLFTQLETGSDSPETFRKKVRTMISKTVSDDEIDNAWSAMIIKFPTENVRYLEQLKQNYRIFALSNTNEIHRIAFHTMFENKFGYSFYNLFEKNFYSHFMGSRKPNLEIYQKALEIANISPNETLFVDDLFENVVAAQKVGMNGLHIEAGKLLNTLPEKLKNCE